MIFYTKIFWNSVGMVVLGTVGVSALPALASLSEGFHSLQLAPPEMNLRSWRLPYDRSLPALASLSDGFHSLQLASPEMYLRSWRLPYDTVDPYLHWHHCQMVSIHCSWPRQRCTWGHEDTGHHSNQFQMLLQPKKYEMKWNTFIFRRQLRF
jgi:hypothetical protein